MGSLVESPHQIPPLRSAAESLQALRHFLPRSSPRLPEVADFEAIELWNSGGSLMMRYEGVSHVFGWSNKGGCLKKVESCPFF